MSYDGLNHLSQLDTGFPTDNASPAELAQALRELKRVMVSVLLVGHTPSGNFREVNGLKLSANSISTQQLQDESVTLGKLANGSVTTSNLVDGCVTAAKLGGLSVVESKYANDSIPGRAFKQKSIPLAALATPLSGNFIASSATSDSARAIGRDHIRDNAINSDKVENLSVAKLSGGNPLEVLINIAGTWTPTPFTGSLSFDSVTGFSITSPVTFAIFADYKARGASGGATTANTWVQRSISEISDPGSLMAFTGNTFTLAVGKYLVCIRVPACNVGRHQARLKVNKGGDISIVAWGSSQEATGANIQNDSTIMGFVDVTSASWIFSVEHWCLNSVGANDLGQPATSDNTVPYANHTEVFTSGFVLKL